MPSHLSLPAASPLPGAWDLPSDPADMALLDWADPGPDERVLLVGPNRLELMCALIRRGSQDVTTVRLPDRLEARSADLVLIANIPAGGLECAVTQARRALAVSGSVIIALPAQHAALLGASTAAHLRRCGFERIRQRAARPELSRPALLRADLVRAKEVLPCGRPLAFDST